MPNQTTIKSYVMPADGCKVEVEADGEVSYTDIGVVVGNVDASLTWTEAKREWANAEADLSVKDMQMDISFEMANLNPANIVRLSSGVLTSVPVSDTSHTTIPAQTIAAGWGDKIKYELVMYASATDSTKLRMATAPVLTSVKLDPDSANETLTAWGAGASGDYSIVADPNSFSGWSIVFNSVSMATGSPKTKEIEITYDANTPVASTILYAGSNSVTLAGYKLRLTHTDSASLKRILDIYNVYTKSGGIQFGFKPVTDSATESIKVTATAKVDGTLTDGRQLMAWTYETGAE